MARLLPWVYARYLRSGDLGVGSHSGGELLRVADIKNNVGATRLCERGGLTSVDLTRGSTFPRVNSTQFIPNHLALC